MPDLSRKRTRERLPARREPHWQKLGLGAYIGFRRGPDTWVARFRAREGGQLYQALGGNIDFDEALNRANAWLSQVGAAPVRTVKRDTVRAALESYLVLLREQGRDTTANEAEGRFKCVVWDDPLANLSLESLTIDDIREWRERLRKGRQPRSVNRHVRAVQAGLTRACRNGHVGNPGAWRIEPLQDDIEDEADTAVHLSPYQRTALIRACEASAGAFLRGLELTGARPGELAAAVAGDLDAKKGLLRLKHRKGRPAKLRTRIVVLDADGRTFFAKQGRDKLPGAVLFPMADGQPWRRHLWSREIRAALSRHNAKARGLKRIPMHASAYSFRHARISELLQVHGVDPLTVANQTGTSIAMIEKAYFRFIPSAMREKLASVGISQARRT